MSELSIAGYIPTGLKAPFSTFKFPVLIQTGGVDDFANVCSIMFINIPYHLRVNKTLTIVLYSLLAILRKDLSKPN